MALSNAERQRRHYERRRAAERAVAAETVEQTLPYLARPFFQVATDDGNWSSFVLALRLAGFDEPTFDDDRGPEFSADLDGLDLPTHLTNSVGRAELMVECLLDAATELAGILNRYKLGELQRAAHSGANADPLIGRLQKNVRWTLPQWKVKGE